MKNLRIPVRIITYSFTTILIAVIFSLAIRGMNGNPTIEELDSSKWVSSGPFESSNDRGRFALTYSFLEDGSLQFSLPVARFASPDLAVTSQGQYVSLFAPGVSFIVMPGYLLGKHFGISQVGAFSVITLFALLNGFLIYLILVELRVKRLASFISAVTFLFATPAFTYAVSLSQHHISTFFLLLGIYALMRWKNWKGTLLVWFLCALSVVVDNPNFFLMLPIGIYGLRNIFSVETISEKIAISVKPFYLLTFAAMIPPMAFFGWYNLNAHGNSFQLAGTLQRVLSVSQEYEENTRDANEQILLEAESQSKDKGREKTAVNFFKTRNLYGGFYTHFISPDRGVLYFTPVVLFGILGLFILYRRSLLGASLFIAILGSNILLYSMWGDPWGGWAFGSRYLIPSYAILCIGVGFVLNEYSKRLIILTLFFLVFSYSVAINTVGALGTSLIPPKAEVLALEEITGNVEKYTYERSFDYLKTNGSKSYVFQTYLNNFFTAEQYYYVIVGMIIFTVFIPLSVLMILARKEND